jgi:hypothetical protein
MAMKINQMLTVLLSLIILGITACIPNSVPWEGENNIRPYSNNPAYWQYKGKPVLLIGGTVNDNLFQIENLVTHLDSLKNVGGNYIRNTMSDRDIGNLHAFEMNSNGKYDLNNWNIDYWLRFENLLKLASERDIIVQIEIWDRFDHSREEWKSDPYNPGNNINYSFIESGLDSIYPNHPGKNEQPFFFTVPELKNNVVLLKYQQRFVEKLLSLSLQYDNVLYCIDNETSGVEEWATYWSGFISTFSQGKDVYITEMWDNWDVKSETHKQTIDHPERYGYIDISQNTQISGPDNWKNSQYVFDYIKDNPRPVNSTKIYGSDRGSWLKRGITTEHAVNTFFRNLLGGFASSRFHRPPHGLGLSNISIKCIQTIREIETIVKFWDIVPRMDLLTIEGDSEVYLSALEGEYYIIYFVKGGKVKLDLSKYERSFKTRWFNISEDKTEEKSQINGGTIAEIVAVSESGSIVIISK